MKNLLKQKLEQHQRPLGLVSQLCSANVIECLGRTGFDFVVIDTEHSALEAETATEYVRAAQLTGITPLARARGVDRASILKLLDIGMAGIVVPCARGIEDIKAVVSYAKFFPVGERGYCPTRKDGWGFASPTDGGMMENMAAFNRETLLIPQCETLGVLEHIEEIAAMDGVDGIFVGPFDLSIAMGIPGQFADECFQAALHRVRKACHENGKFCMSFAGNEDAVLSGFAAGYDAMVYEIDAVHFISALKARVESVKEKL